MPILEEKEILVQLTELRQQMTSVNTSVDEIKSSVREVLALDRTIAQLSIHHELAAKEIQKQWSRLDENRESIEAVDRKADEWINKARGAWVTLMILGSLAQGAVLGSVAYTFNHLRTAEDAVLLINHRVLQLEAKQK